MLIFDLFFQFFPSDFKLLLVNDAELFFHLLQVLFTFLLELFLLFEDLGGRIRTKRARAVQGLLLLLECGDLIFDILNGCLCRLSS